VQSRFVAAVVAAGLLEAHAARAEDPCAADVKGLCGDVPVGGGRVQCEVCRKEGDRGGIPVRVDGRLQILEELRLPSHFDANTVKVFNANTFLAAAELTAQMRSRYLEVPRDGARSRFLPVKDFDELAKRRATIEEVARAAACSSPGVRREGATAIACTANPRAAAPSAGEYARCNARRPCSGRWAYGSSSRFSGPPSRAWTAVMGSREAGHATSL
jgi:hypothetical protein